MHFPRLVAQSELATNKSLADTEIIDLRNEEKRQEITRKNYNYNVSYAYTMDGISAFCTDNAGTGKIHLLENNYYSIRVTSDEWEDYCLGDNYKKDKIINRRFWDNFKDIAKEPKTLVMVTDEGIFLGEPIRILVKRKDDNRNAHGGNTSNLKTWNKELQVRTPIENASAIDYIQIDFFRPLFKTAVEDNKNWLPLPRYLQAILDYTELYTPEKLRFMYVSRYSTPKEMRISTQTARKYFLYVNANTNFLGDYMNISAIDFWKCVNPTRIRAIEKENENGKKYNAYFFKAWYEDKQAMDCLVRLHRYLADTNRLDGINFTTCGVWYDPNKKEYKIQVYRQKPLNKDTPPFIETDEEKIEYQKWLENGNFGTFKEFMYAVGYDKINSPEERTYRKDIKSVGFNKNKPFGAGYTPPNDTPFNSNDIEF